MKIRTGFVSNSSSSSYTCVSCGEVQSGWDMGLSEADFKVCQNGHLLCSGCSPADEGITETILNMTKKEFDKFLTDIDRKTGYWIPDRAEELFNKIKTSKDKVSTVTISEPEEMNTVQNLASQYIPESMCPFCTLDEMEDYEMLKYLLEKLKINRDELQKEIKEEFKTLEKVRMYLANKQKERFKVNESNRTDE